MSHPKKARKLGCTWIYDCCGLNVCFGEKSGGCESSLHCPINPTTYYNILIPKKYSIVRDETVSVIDCETPVSVNASVPLSSIPIQPVLS